MTKAEDYKIIVRGAGDIATGSIARLFRAGFRPICLEIANPSAIRRTVAFCDAVYEGCITIEGITARLAENLQDAIRIASAGEIPILVDEEAETISAYKPDVVIDAILAKKNMGTSKKMAALTIALGPGFTAGEDCDYVIETMRGHKLARIIDKGPAMPNTGTPGLIAGHDKDRVIHAPASGICEHVHEIGDSVEEGQPIAYIIVDKGEGSDESPAEKVPVPASISGLLRGIIREGYKVRKGLKMADIDPRLDEYENCFTISDKAYAIGGSVLELVTADFINKYYSRHSLNHK